MKRYRIVEPIVLGFLARLDQVNVLVKPEDDAVLESDGETIWLINERGRHESITNVNLLNGVAVEEITDER